MTVMVTNNDTLDAQAVLRLYQSRNEIERLFDNMKNEMENQRLRTKSVEVMEGRLFVMFLAIILYCAVDRIMEKKQWYRKNSIPGILAEMKKLRQIEFQGGNTCVTEVTKKQREILAAFGVSIPA